MTNLPGTLVQRVQRRLVQQSYARALLCGITAGVLVWLAASLLLQNVGPASSARTAWAPIAAGTTTAVLVAWWFRTRDGVITRQRAALWLEERFPALKFALVTLAEFDGDSSRELPQSARDRLVTAVGAPDVTAPLNRSALQQLRWPLPIALLLLVVAGLLHARLSRTVAANSSGTSETKRTVADSDTPPNAALAKWRVRVIPPVYTGLPSRQLDDATQVTALIGSRLEVVGSDRKLPTAILHSTADSVVPATLAVVSLGQGWQARFSMPDAPADARFTLGSANRQLLLEPRIDSLPVVHLQMPLRDSVYREPKGRVALNATAHDDLGLARVNFELIVTSGEGERFTAKTAMVGAQQASGQHEQAWQATLSLDTMGLVAGDIVHMRAVARDRNPDPTRESGTSETRTFRIARTGEYDSVAVEPAPPPEVQKSLMSQRMLLIMTEKLEARRRTVSRETLVAESRKLASDQARLRKAVGNLVFQRLEGEDSGEHAHSADDGHDHGVAMEQGKLVMTGSGATGVPMTDGEGGDSPIVGINKPLLEAFNAMWDATSALEVAEPNAAIPHMKIALAAIERARSAERIYLRGKPPVVIVDIAKVRLVGKDTGQRNERAAREALSPREAARGARLLAAALLLQGNATAGRDSLALLRLESLADAPRFAAALNDVLEVVRQGGDATPALVRARRLLSGGAKSDSLTRWRGP